MLQYQCVTIVFFLENPPNPFEEILSMHDPITTEAERIQRILDIKYAPADLNQVGQDCTHLTDAEKSALGKRKLH